MPNVPDPRHISNGFLLPSEGYADQPYVVRTDDGAWLCVLTTGKGHEGEPGQHVISMRSMDQGRTWSEPVDVEPATGPEASYAVLLKVPSGRIYCFYNHNTDNVREVKREDGGVFKRVDSLGHFVFKYSDDHGRSWSSRRYEVPVREFECDRNNVYGGKLRFFWNVGKAVVVGETAYVPLHKVGAMGPGFFAQSEGVFLRSDNILAERDPERIRFETLPEGEVGLRAPQGAGRIAEEQSLTVLSDGSLYCVYRTVAGHPAAVYSRDGGRTWIPPRFKTYTPGGRRVKHPRAANFVWRCSNGRYLYWFHNHGGPAVHQLPGGWDPYADRNPVWIMAGVEQDSPDGKVLHWSQPEILLYDDDPFIRMSYPDLVEENGRFFVTETQKRIARIHEIDPALLDGLFRQRENEQVATRGRVLELPPNRPLLRQIRMPRLPDFHRRDTSQIDYPGFDTRSGFTLDFWVRLPRREHGRVLLDNRTETGQGFRVATTDAGTLEISLQDGRSHSAWDCDPGVITPGQLHHVTVIVDGGPKIICFVVDGILCDGGDHRQFGWGRFSPTLRSVNGAQELQVDSEAIRSLRIYNRALRISEAVGNYHADRKHLPGE